jgi:hypothetical protein
MGEMCLSVCPLKTVVEASAALVLAAQPKAVPDLAGPGPIPPATRTLSLFLSGGLAALAVLSCECYQLVFDAI